MAVAPLIPSPTPSRLVASARGLRQSYRSGLALDGIDLDVPAGVLAGVVGPDGVGKSTLLGLLAGARHIQAGALSVLGGDMRDAAHRAAVCTRIGYVPQGVGASIYPSLTVAENLDFFGRLFGLGARERTERASMLIAATALGDVARRPAGVLSGGMQQKLGLCCAFMHGPELLLLDEPTTGIDPLSRHQFWRLIGRMRADAPGLSVLAATVYMEEAEGFDWLALLGQGRLLAAGPPEQLMARAGARRLEDAYVALLPRAGGPRVQPRQVLARVPAAALDTVITARDLTRRYGNVVAVDHVDLEIRRGEIFGFVGPNGSGKTSILKMVTGLLPPSSGEVRVHGRALASTDVAQRRRVGYMSQGFSLYGELTVRRNLELHARLYDVPEAEVAARVAALLERFELDSVQGVQADSLSRGMAQRLSLAVAVIHRPETLILDEPTAGVDPLTRGRFWDLLTALRAEGVTILLSTHYLDEAARCDRIALMSDGRMLACAAPQSLVRERGAASLEEAFISRLREDAPSLEDAGPTITPAQGRTWFRHPSPADRWLARSARVWAVVRREAIELWRDRTRLVFSLVVPPVLMVVYGFGYSLDVDRVAYAALDRDRTPESRRYLELFSGSRYFEDRGGARSPEELDARLVAGTIRVAVEIPAGFGRDLRSGRQPKVAVWIDGTLPYRAEVARAYVQALHQSFVADLARRAPGATPALTATLEPRFRYNPQLRSRVAIVPGLLAVVLAIVPALLAGVAVARERELGSIANLSTTPLGRLEFLWGKQLPLLAISAVGLVLLAAVAVLVFRVPMTGSFLAYTIGGLLYVAATTSLGLAISVVARTQAAGLVAAAILTIIPAFAYSGLLRPVPTLTGAAAVMARIFPGAYFRNVAVGAFTKGLGPGALLTDYMALLVIAAALSVVGVLLLKKQRA